MSFEAAAWALRQKPETAHQKLVLIALADCYNQQTSRCDPSVVYLAEVCICARTTVMKAIDDLIRQGFVSETKRHGTRSNYRLIMNEEVVRQADQSATRTSPSGRPEWSVCETTSGPSVQQSGPSTLHKPGSNQEYKPGSNQEVIVKDSAPKKPRAVSPDVERVFDHWRQTMGHDRARLDAKREKVIRDRLKDQYSVDDLMLAIDGCKKSPWHQGENDRRQVYDDLALILRDGTHVDRFIKLASVEVPMFSVTGQANARAINEWLEETSCEKQTKSVLLGY